MADEIISILARDKHFVWPSYTVKNKVCQTHSMVCYTHSWYITIDTPTWKKCVYCDIFGVSTHFIFYSVLANKAARWNHITNCKKWHTLKWCHKIIDLFLKMCIKSQWNLKKSMISNNATMCIIYVCTDRQNLHTQLLWFYPCMLSFAFKSAVTKEGMPTHIWIIVKSCSLKCTVT